ncbi:MAG: trans-aconitate 2-methyltransferase [Acidimicrobiales bacterium]
MARRAARTAAVWGRRLGVLAYRPERWTTEQWDAAHAAGSLGYYGGLGELARYSVIAGYVAWFAAERPDRPPTVLDVGCGAGLLRRHLEGAPFAEYVGVDLSGAAIQAATTGMHARSRFVKGDIAELDLGRFDVVVLNEVLYYAPDARVFLQRARSALHADGLLVVSMWRHPRDRSLWRILDEAFSLVDRVAVRNRANPVNRRGWWIGCYRAAGRGPG